MLRRKGNILIEVNAFLIDFEVKTVRFCESSTFKNDKVKKVDRDVTELTGKNNDPFEEPIKDPNKKTTETRTNDEENIINISLVKEEVPPGVSKARLDTVEEEVGEGRGERGPHSSALDLKVIATLVGENIVLEDKEHTNPENSDSGGGVVVGPKDPDDNIYPFNDRDRRVECGDINGTELGIRGKGGDLELTDQGNGAHDTRRESLDETVEVTRNPNRKLVGAPTEAGDNGTEGIGTGFVDFGNSVENGEGPGALKSRADEVLCLTEEGRVRLQEAGNLGDKPLGLGLGKILDYRLVSGSV
jgi:hypothetical protein